VVLDDCNFHDCVRLDEFESSRTLSFLPPDGEFALLNYRITQEFRAPFRIFPTVEETSPTKVRPRHIRRSRESGRLGENRGSREVSWRVAAFWSSGPRTAVVTHSLLVSFWICAAGDDAHDPGRHPRGQLRRQRAGDASLSRSCAYNFMSRGISPMDVLTNPYKWYI
jgi:hypothetical protein